MNYEQKLFLPEEGGKQEALFERIDRLRLAALETKEKISYFSDRVYYFDDALKHALEEKFDDENLRKAVPEWHKLVGSTPEDHEANPEAKAFIASEVEHFISELEAEWEN